MTALQKDMLMRIRRDAAREDFENRNIGRFRRIFPPDDKFLREKYAGMLADAFSVFLSGRTTSLQKEIQRTYTGQLKVSLLLWSLHVCLCKVLVVSSTFCCLQLSLVILSSSSLLILSSSSFLPPLCLCKVLVISSTFC